MKTPIKAVLLALGLATALAGATATSASAETVWQRHHPGRVEVNHRLYHQHGRLRQEVREGEIGPRKARMIRAEDRSIHAQERFYASRHHGHLTHRELRRLNREENGVSRQIGR
jgi:hypothetical protein